MKILHLSDTHGLHLQIKDLPGADVIIHSGDISHNKKKRPKYLEVPEIMPIFATSLLNLTLE